MLTIEAKQRDREDPWNPTLQPTRNACPSASDQIIRDSHNGGRLPMMAGLTLLFLGGCNGPRFALDTMFWLDETSAVKVHARGVHFYVSRPSPDREGSSIWQLKRISADLYDATGRQIGRQSSPSTWEATDRSKVTGTVLAAMPSPTLSAVPWILYESRSNSTRGLFAHVTRVRRVFTWGGKPPRSPPGETSEGKEVGVRFGATYYFQRGAGPVSRADGPQATGSVDRIQRAVVTKGRMRPPGTGAGGWTITHMPSSPTVRGSLEIGRPGFSWGLPDDKICYERRLLLPEGSLKG